MSSIEKRLRIGLAGLSALALVACEKPSELVQPTASSGYSTALPKPERLPGPAIDEKSRLGSVIENLNLEPENPKELTPGIYQVGNIIIFQESKKYRFKLDPQKLLQLTSQCGNDKTTGEIDASITDTISYSRGYAPIGINTPMDKVFKTRDTLAQNYKFTPGKGTVGMDNLAKIVLNTGVLYDICFIIKAKKEGVFEQLNKGSVNLDLMKRVSDFAVQHSDRYYDQMITGQEKPIITFYTGQTF